MAQCYTFADDLISVIYKDAYGMRPSNDFMVNWNSSTSEQKQEIWNDLAFELACVISQEKKDHEQAMVQFEREITSRVQQGYERKAAIRSIVEALNEKNSIDVFGGSYVCYLLNLPYSMTREIDRAIF